MKTLYLYMNIKTIAMEWRILYVNRNLMLICKNDF